jgi:small redox-active disulfide protein 2
MKGKEMTVQILGTGCSKCNQLEENAKKAVNELNLTAVIEKISDIQKIQAMGVLFTPALGIDGAIKSAGKLLTVEEIKKLLQG